MAKKISDSKIWAFISYLTIIGFIIALVQKRKDKFVMYHAAQSLVLMILAVAIWIVSSIFFGMFLFMPAGIFTIYLIIRILWLAWLVLLIIGIVYAFTGKQKPLPVIGSWGEKIKL